MDRNIFSCRTGFPAAVALALFAACDGFIPAVNEEEAEETVQTAQGITCGVERWSVKTGTDPNVGGVNFTPQDTPLATLVGFQAPSSLPANSRVSAQELTTYRLTDVTLTKYKLENDSDIHLVVSDGTHTMIAEIPLPGCVGAGSPFAAGIQNARAQFNAAYVPGPSFETANVPVSLIGVGFFDFQHEQTGVAPNAFELHAVLGLCFGAGCDVGGGSTNDFSITASPSSQNVAPGAAAVYAVSTAVTGGNAQTVSLSASGLPRGTSAFFDPSSLKVGGNSTMTVPVGSETARGGYALTVVGTGSSGAHATSVWLAVTSDGGFASPDDFSMAVSTSGEQVIAGGSTELTVSTAVTHGAAQAVRLSFSDLPSGITALFSPPSVTTGNDSLVTVDVAEGTAAGSYWLTLLGAGTAISHSTVVALAVEAPSGGVVTNGDFESGLAGWTVMGNATVSTTSHGGNYSAQVGSNSPSNDSALTQTVTLPPGIPLLSFWYQVVCPDTVQYDWASVEVKSTTGAVLVTVVTDTCTDTGVWVNATANLAAYAGQTVVISLNNHDDDYSGDPTYTLYDDVSIWSR